MICLVLSFYMLMILCCWLSQLTNFNIFSPYVHVNYLGLTWTLILRNLVVYELVLVVILNATISQPPAAACSLPRVTEIRYLGIHITQSQLFKWSFDQAKRAFHRSLNAIFGKIGRFASEEVIYLFIYSKFSVSTLWKIKIIKTLHAYMAEHM